MKLNENFTCLIPVPLKGLGGQVDGKIFLAKEEVHMTIIGFKTAKIIKNAVKENPAILTEIEAIFSGSLEYMIEDHCFYIQREQEAAIIQTIQVQAITAMYEKLNALLHTNIPIPFTHATIATCNSKMGIGINSQEEFPNFKPEEVRWY